MSYSEQLLEKIGNNDFSGQADLLKKALDHDDPEILASLAEELTAIGFSDLASDVYRKLIVDFPKEDIFKVYLAEILINDGKTDDGLSFLYDIDANSDAYLNSLLILADYYQSNGFGEAALEKLQEAAKIAPDEPVIWFALAEYYYNDGQFLLAQHYYQQLLANDVDEVGGVLIETQLAKSLAKSGDYEQAITILSNVNAENLSTDSKYEVGLIYLQAGEYQMAIDRLREVIEVNPDYVNAYPNLVQAYLALDDNDNALKMAQIGLGYNQFDETLYQLGATAAARLDELDTSAQLLEKGLSINPDNSSLRLELSNLYLLQHEDQKNLNLFDEIEDADLDDQSHWNRAVSFDRLDQVENSQAEYLLAYRSFNDNLDFLRQFIYFLRQNSQIDLLKAALDQYLKIEPDDEEMIEMRNNI